MSQNQLAELTNAERLVVYQKLIGGCSHLWSKGKLQKDKVIPWLQFLAKLGKDDPIFLAHLTAYIIKNSQSKDLLVTSIFCNSLSDADGTPFSPKSKYKKPNLRYVSWAAIQDLDPKLVYRVKQLAMLKFGIAKVMDEAAHQPTGLINAIKKYLRFRETKTQFLEGIRKSGLRKIYIDLYRKVRMKPSDLVCSIMKWKQKDGRDIELQKSIFNFEGMTPLAIAKKIRSEKLSVLGVVGALPKITPVIAVALLEQASGKEALILRKLFEDQGILKDKEVAKLFGEKIVNAKTVVDRAETLSKTASEDVQKIIKNAKSAARKQETVGIGKIYMHIDKSGSMQEAITFAKHNGAIIAECVNDPVNNFRWGAFDPMGHELKLPEEFTADAFQAALYGLVADGGTDAFALYPIARKFGADVDVILTDQDHNSGDLENKIKTFHEKNPNIAKPKACVIINFGHMRTVENAYKANGIPVSILEPRTLSSSALVVESIKTAIRGPEAVIDSIMSTVLPDLPNWYYCI